YTKAARCSAAVLRIPPGRLADNRRALALRLMAEPLLALRPYKEAGAALDLFLTMTPQPAPGGDPEQIRRVADALKARGLLHAEQKDFRAAIECYTRGLALLRDQEMFAQRGWAYLASGAPALAL